MVRFVFAMVLVGVVAGVEVGGFGMVLMPFAGYALGMFLVYVYRYVFLMDA